MSRVNVFLKDDLLSAIDAEAKSAGINRSALIQRALAHYLDTARREREESRKRQEMEEACRGMDALADKLGSWDPVQVIREFRENRALQVAEPRKPYKPRSRKTRT